MANQAKTNAMRLLDSAGAAYTVHTYESKGAIDGVSVAQKIGKAPADVFKTLVTRGTGREYYVFVIPVESELDLKKAAKAVGEKAVSMIPVADIQKVTGYVRGGCSPFGMKKQYRTVLDISAQTRETIVVSAGRIGLQVETAPQVILDLAGALQADITHE